jgi:hypothetical protein
MFHYALKGDRLRFTQPHILGLSYDVNSINGESVPEFTLQAINLGYDIANIVDSVCDAADSHFKLPNLIKSIQGIGTYAAINDYHLYPSSTLPKTEENIPLANHKLRSVRNPAFLRISDTEALHATDDLDAPFNRRYYRKNAFGPGHEIYFSVRDVEPKDAALFTRDVMIAHNCMQYNELSSILAFMENYDKSLPKR